MKPSKDASRRSYWRVAAGLSLGVTLLTVCGGCRLCCEPDYGAFPAYGGSWERTQRHDGRVGSLFDPGGAKVGEMGDRDEKRGSQRLEAEQRFEKQRPEESDRGNEMRDRQEEDPKVKEERDRKFEEKRKQFENEQMQEIDVYPGQPLPPDIF